ncbi:hypothetical protein [Haloferula sp.]|uniref:hypothetical protein n=1 Tax=Haloferula sp. TaxID=2497595 RepID=UPI00329B12CA
MKWIETSESSSLRSSLLHGSGDPVYPHFLGLSTDQSGDETTQILTLIFSRFHLKTRTT